MKIVYISPESKIYNLCANYKKVERIEIDFEKRYIKIEEKDGGISYLTKLQSAIITEVKK